MEEKQFTSYSEHYFEICKNNFFSYIKLREDYKSIWERIEYLTNKYEEEGEEEYKKEIEHLLNEAADIKNQRDAAGHISIIFSAMCLEAIINHYAINRTSKTFFENYLDKLDVKAKWVIIPKLLSNVEFNRESQAFELLGKFVKLRNDLVHYKSRVIRFPANMTEQMEKDEKDFYSNVRNSIQAIFSVVEELKRIDPNWKEHIWYQLSKIEHPELQKYI
ncbi:MAG: hypothetical protein IIC76_15325 [Bacteroidetes bacterium]|nr:hypothetical protein [Bacteroidota bacterium]